MIPDERVWNRKPGASIEGLDLLKRAAPVELPQSYFHLLAFSNGGEGPLSVQPLYFALYDVEYTAEGIISNRYDEFFPGFVIFGSTGGGAYIAFDIRGPSPLPIVHIDMCNIDLEESVWPLAPDFDSFLALIGVDAPDDA
jgi:hypothetical protein